MTKFHHKKLPGFSTILCGRKTQNDYGFESKSLQIWYNKTTEEWKDDRPHAHKECDECFIVIKGKIDVDVDGELHTIHAGEFCCFPKGVFHSIIKVYPPIESYMIRAPSIEDKVHKT
jgi:mannose-6-phosphate isomerase-like protein (cupin superfamily)